MPYTFIKGIPFHLQIRQVIEGEINSGAYPPGSLLPGELELCLLYGVSRPTVRQALNSMVNDGLLERHRGRGTFVRNAKEARTSLTIVVPSSYVENATRALVKKYVMENPGVQVNVISEPFHIAVNLMHRSRWLNEPGAVDIIMVPSTFMCQVANSGLIEPLNSYIDRSPKALTSDWLTTESGQTALDLMCARKVKGSERKIFGLPYQNDVQVMFYRKDCLGEAGLNVPDSIHSYIEAVRLLHSKHWPNIYGTVISGNPETLCIIDAWLWILKSLGGSLFTADMEPCIDSAVGVESLSIYKELFEYSPPESHRFSSYDSALAMNSGKVALMPNWHIFADYMEHPGSPVNGKIGYALLPGGRCQLAGWELCLCAQSSNKERAFSLMQFLISNDSEVQDLFQREGGDSYRLASITNPVFIKRDPVYSIAREAWWSGWTIGEWSDYDRFALAIIQSLENLLFDGISPNIAARQMARALAIEARMARQSGEMLGLFVNQMVLEDA